MGLVCGELSYLWVNLNMDFEMFSMVFSRTPCVRVVLLHVSPESGKGSLLFSAWLSGLGEAVTRLLSQFALAALVLSLLLPKSSQYVKWIVAAGLAQVSELSFVLGSRARRAGIISREVSVHPHCVCVQGALASIPTWHLSIPPAATHSGCGARALPHIGEEVWVTVSS